MNTTKEKRPCGYGGKCRTLTEVDASGDMPSLGMYCTKWCDKHMKEYVASQKILDALVPEYNKMNLIGLNGRVIKFKYGHEISNYLCRYGKRRELNKILKGFKKQ